MKRCGAGCRAKHAYCDVEAGLFVVVPPRPFLYISPRQLVGYVTSRKQLRELRDALTKVLRRKRER